MATIDVNTQTYKNPTTGQTISAKTGLPVDPTGMTPTPEQLSARTAATAATGNPIADSGIRRETGSAASGGSALDQFISGLNLKAPDAARQDAIKREQLDLVQRQLDAIDATFASKLSDEAVRATGRLGQGRSINARSGLLDSSFGNQRTGAIEDVNKQARDAIIAEREATKATVFDKAAQRALDLIKNETDAALKNADTYIDYLKGKQQDARNDLSALFKSGISLAELSTDEYSRLLEQTGYTPTQAHAMEVLNKPQASVLTSFTVGNKYYVVTQDPITGERKTDTLDLGFNVPAEYKSQKLDDGTIVFFPDKFDPNKPIKDQLITYGVQSDAYKLDIAQKNANLSKTYAEIDKLKASGDEDPVVISDLQGAAAAIAAGADPDKVRQRFLDNHPKKGDLYLKYTKQAY